MVLAPKKVLILKFAVGKFPMRQSLLEQAYGTKGKVYDCVLPRTPFDPVPLI